MPRGKAHPPEVKAAVMAALMAGQGVPHVAEEFSLPEDTVRTWARGPQFAEVQRKKGERIEELTFEYLSALLASLRAQVQIVSAKAYLMKQSASEVAVLHGVLADKAFRLLASLPPGVRDAADGKGPGQECSPDPAPSDAA